MGSERTGAGAGLGGVDVGSVLPRVQWKADWSKRYGAAVGAAPFLSQSEWIWPFWAGSRLDNNNDNTHTYTYTHTERERAVSWKHRLTFSALHIRTHAHIRRRCLGVGETPRHFLLQSDTQWPRRAIRPTVGVECWKHFSFPQSSLVLNKNRTTNELDVYGPFELLNSELNSSFFWTKRTFKFM